ncbi:HNH endonuclease [Halostella sp. JP-L12]|uniref:HNH endonuclease n=1 Tax=Halostella TaxID=1843185 RepID=UPI000EF7C767|nr:HNH endonuclease [Halostella sp. JP-L12]
MTHTLTKLLVASVYKSVGLDSPYSAKGYGPNWSRQRRKCLERDSRTCRICGSHETELGREPSVHHITPRSRFDDSEWRDMNDLSNLITLCPSCHGQYEGKYTDCSPEEFVQKASEA